MSIFFHVSYIQDKVKYLKLLKIHSKIDISPSEEYEKQEGKF